MPSFLPQQLYKRYEIVVFGFRQRHGLLEWQDLWARKPQVAGQTCKMLLLLLLASINDKRLGWVALLLQCRLCHLLIHHLPKFVACHTGIRYELLTVFVVWIHGDDFDENVSSYHCFCALMCAELVLECEGASQTNTCDPWRMSKISEFEQRIASIHRWNIRRGLICTDPWLVCEAQWCSFLLAACAN